MNYKFYDWKKPCLSYIGTEPKQRTLQKQIDTLSEQLKSAEETLKSIQKARRP